MTIIHLRALILKCNEQCVGDGDHHPIIVHYSIKVGRPCYSDVSLRTWPYQCIAVIMIQVMCCFWAFLPYRMPFLVVPIVIVISLLSCQGANNIYVETNVPKITTKPKTATMYHNHTSLLSRVCPTIHVEPTLSTKSTYGAENQH